MNRTGLLAEFATLAFYCAVVYLLVKPGSHGAGAVETVTTALAGLISAATAPFE
jgi:hypothetical protein